MRVLPEIVNQNPTTFKPFTRHDDAHAISFPHHAHIPNEFHHTCFLHVDFNYVLYMIPHPLGSEQFCVDQRIHVQVPPPVDWGGGNIEIATEERYVWCGSKKCSLGTFQSRANNNAHLGILLVPLRYCRT